MNILEEIIAHKREEVEERREIYPVKLLERSLHFDAPIASMKKYLLNPDKSGIIAEFKRRSPSKGDINPFASVEQVSLGYMQAGSSGLSVLTDKTFFGGSSEDLMIAREWNFCPILRKDFIIDEYQVYETRSIGADLILLIAGCLSAAQVAHLARVAKNIGLEVLLEVHSSAELEKLCDEVDLVGVNNRDLQTFTLNVETSLRLADLIPEGFIKISESGISNPQSIIDLKGAGYRGFLIGEYFMQTANPARTCKMFIQAFQEKGNLVT